MEKRTPDIGKIKNKTKHTGSWICGMVASLLILTGCASFGSDAMKEIDSAVNGSDGVNADGTAEVSKNIQMTQADTTVRINECLQNVIQASGAVQSELMKMTAEHTDHTSEEYSNLSKELERLTETIDTEMKNLQSFNPSPAQQNQLVHAEEDIQALRNSVESAEQYASEGNKDGLKTIKSDINSDIRVLQQDQKGLFD